MAYADLTDNQRTWVDALRSDKYKQTANTLTQIITFSNPDFFEPVDEPVVRHCCLGVACVVAELPASEGDTDVTYGKMPDAMDPDKLEAIKEAFSWSSNMNTGWTNATNLPIAAQVWLDSYDANVELPFGMTIRSQVHPDDEYSHLLEEENTHYEYLECTELNDNGMTFAQIADLVCYFGIRPLRDRTTPRVNIPGLIAVDLL